MIDLVNLSGKAWVFGDDVNTDVLAPGIYMKGSIENLARHCLESVMPEFSGSVQAGDIIIAGENFGIGSSREQAAEVLKTLGVSAIIARSFGGIFYRNAINFGLLAVTYQALHDITSGDNLRLDIKSGLLENRATETVMACEVIPPHLMKIITAGGLVAYLEQNFSQGRGVAN